MRRATFSTHTMLLGLCAVLGLGLLYQIHSPPADYPIPQLVPQEQEPLSLNYAAYEPPERAPFEIVTNRSIFNPERIRVEFPPEPVEAPPPPPPPPPPAPPEIALIGIIADGTRRIAMIREAGEPFAVGLHLGTDIEGWEVSEISEDAVTLQLRETTHVVALRRE